MRKIDKLAGASLGQHWPRQKPKPEQAPERSERAAAVSGKLGRPLSIQQVSQLIGLSPWSVRNCLIRKGLPHFRSGASGKFIFYEQEVIAWLEKQQQGGTRK